MPNNQKQEQENELAEQHKHIAEVVNLLRLQVEELSALAYDILTEKPETVEEWNIFVQRYNFIEATKPNGEKEQ